MIQAAPSATLSDVFTAAVATYGGPNASTLSSQWTTISMAEILAENPDLAKSMSDVDFSGQVSVNLQSGEVIIADRGTVPTSGKNLITDSQIAVGAELNAQPVADAFALAGLAAAQQKLSEAGVTMSALYTTGHSLGGAESQGQTAMLSVATNPDGTPILPAGVHITNVSLDAPGIAGLADAGNSNNYTSYNFSAQGDLVNLAGGSDLSGTTNVNLPVGPSMWATGD